MLKSVGKLVISSENSTNVCDNNQSPGTPEPCTPGGTTTRPRKKLSFKEPEFFSYLKMKRSSFKKKLSIENQTSSSSPTTSSSIPSTPSTPPTPRSIQTTNKISLNNNYFKEEDEEEVNDENYDELESQAMRVVRTIGQAFEVCHKLSVNAATDERDQDITIDKERSRDRSEDHLLRSDDYEDEMTNERQDTINRPRSSSPNVNKDISLSNDGDDVNENHQNTTQSCILRTHGSSTSPIRQSPLENVDNDILLLGENELTSLKHEIQLLRERLDQQNQQTCAAVSHARLLQDQLAAESAARVEAQTRTHQLLIQNKELLEHIGALVSHLREQERTSGTHVTMQQHNTIGTGSSVNPQTPTAPNIPNLGQVTLYQTTP